MILHSVLLLLYLSPYPIPAAFFSSLFFDSLGFTVKNEFKSRSNMAEEHRCQTPEGHRLCANNCGFFGSAATMNLCSKCYRDFFLRERQQQQQEASIKATLTLPSSSSPLPVVFDSPPSVPVAIAPEVRAAVAPEVSAAVEQPNRCSMCRKRVGLTGFKCRCGTTFCGTHRYPEKHNCSFDFRKIGREEIAKANPLVVAEKLEKI